MEDKFISKCSYCGRHGLYDLRDVISLNRQEKLTGFVSCVDCEKQVLIELTRCEKCGAGWCNHNEVPTAVELNDVRQPIVLTMVMPCLTCEPWVKKYQETYRHPFIEPP